MNPELLNLRRELMRQWVGATDGKHLDLAVEYLQLGYELGRRVPAELIDGPDPDDEPDDA
jgi:hypothetical protein